MTTLRINLFIITIVLGVVVLIDYSLPADLSLYVKSILFLAIILYIPYLVIKYKAKEQK
ncbi:hypothetical protein [Guptibacillus hwajinpoensis]|uniref:Uncharacterized protein n=1 Tax=Guptibacillus hwajinpoensis TaxID=208199 RepID=A0ABU0K241_9BACL|nr:hypothetical protein [Alkalihalobacillus hemicentroti]MDQ0483423.1 hypothetical protein [Alkalihalobacillus hemicentroti]